jgi:hypothetical protein
MFSITNGEKGKFFTALPTGRHGLPQHSFLFATILNEKINKICHPYQADNFHNSKVAEYFLHIINTSQLMNS